MAEATPKARTRITRQTKPRVTPDQNQEMISASAEQSVVMCGNFSSYKGEVEITNTTDQKIVIRGLALKHPKKTKDAGFKDVALINATLEPKATKKVSIGITIPDKAAPGKYTSKLVVNNTEVPMSWEVQERYKVTCCPAKFVTQGVQKEKPYQFKMMMKNEGNVDYVIPKFGHTLNRDIQMDCKARSQSLLKEAKQGMAAFEDGVAKYSSASSGWSKISFLESGKTIPAGEMLPVTLELTLPDNVSVNSSYYGDIAVFSNHIIEYQILA